MRFFHPGPNSSNKFVPGASRRRRERFKLHEQARQAVQNHPPAIPWESYTWDWWGAPGRILAAEPCDAQPHALQASDGALRIVQGCAYDPGNAAYRFHTAINETSKHASAFIRFGHTNPFCDLRQIDGDTHLVDARGACYTADVIHSHVDYWMQKKCSLPKKWRARAEQLVIRHYHGTRHKGVQWPLLNMLEDDIANVVIVGARLTVCATRPSKIKWLPIAVPVRRYRALVPKVRRPGPFRIAHSPTRTDYKGTPDLIAAVETLRRKGLPVELIMIERRKHGDALAMKAEADLTFDSFWLGLQGSGLEAASMGQMVVAGDASVRDLYVASEVGECPYTFAEDRKQLIEVLERAIVEPEWRASEAKRIGQYVAAYHDYAAVARRYEGIIAEVTGWTNVATKRPRGRPRVIA